LRKNQLTADQLIKDNFHTFSTRDDSIK